jgi:hypothetical protein
LDRADSRAAVAMEDQGRCSRTGKTRLLIALGTIAAEQGRRVHYLTCAQLVNELAEAADHKQPLPRPRPLRPARPARPRRDRLPHQIPEECPTLGHAIRAIGVCRTWARREGPSSESFPARMRDSLSSPDSHVGRQRRAPTLSRHRATRDGSPVAWNPAHTEAVL